MSNYFAGVTDIETFILNYLIDVINSVHFGIIDLKRKIEYNIVKCSIVILIKGD